MGEAGHESDPEKCWCSTRELASIWLGRVQTVHAAVHCVGTKTRSAILKIELRGRGSARILGNSACHVQA
jgi:3-methyladenine DNA glycosylase AlkD